MTRFQYRRLNLNRSEIRIVIISPNSNAGDIVSCRLLHVSLDCDPKYEALSYTWADVNKDSSLTQPILLDGRQFLVTRNLDAALRQLRHSLEARIMWIDAVCINQEDPKERSEQVNKMKSIYQKASRVAIWLGPQYKNSEYAMQFLSDIDRFGDLKAFYDSILEIAPQEAVANLIFEDYLAATAHLCVRPYWRRVWILQEVALAREIHLYCGGHSICWDILRNAFDIINRDPDFFSKTLRGLDYGQSGIIRHWGPNILEWGKGEESRPPLSSLLLRHKTKLCKDPRDKIYGLLSLLGDGGQQRSFPVDYERDFKEVFIDLAWFLVTTESSLDILAMSQTKDLVTRDLPSWVPNWTDPFLSMTINRVWNAAGSSTPQVIFDVSSATISVGAVCIGTVTSISEPNIEHLQGDIKYDTRVLHDWWAFFCQTGAQGTADGESFCHLFLRVRQGEFSNFRTGFVAAGDDFLCSLAALLRVHHPSFTPHEQLRRYSNTDFSEHRLSQAEEDIQFIAGCCKGQRLVRSSSEKIGVVSAHAQVGDLICVVLGCSVPVLFRCQGNYFLNIGEIFIDGFMDGEAVDGLEDGKYMLETFELH